MSEMTAPEAAPDSAPEAVEDAWSGPSQEEWQSVQETLGYLAQQFQPEPEPQASEQDFVQFDPFAEDPGNQIRAIIREELAPLQQHQQQEQLQEAEERAYDIMDDLVASEGDFTGDRAEAFQWIRTRADLYMPEMAQKHGFGPAAAEAAISKAFKELKSYEDAVGQKYYEQRMNQITNLAGARVDPGTLAAAAQTANEPGGDEMSVIARYGGFGPPSRPRPS